MTPRTTLPDGESLYRTFEATLEGFAQAVRVCGRTIHTFRIAGRHLRICTAGPALVPDLTHALEHLAAPDHEIADVTIYAWDSASTGVPAPPRLPPGMYVTRDSLLHGVVQEKTAALQVFDPAQRVGVVWQAHAGATYTYASPQRELLAAAAQTWGLTGFHAAAVGTPDGALLLTGIGGTGKSTTALACALAGMLFVAEDFCLTAMQPCPTVHTLYSSARLSATSQSMLQMPDSAATGLWFDDKQVYLLHRAQEIKLADKLPVRAVLALRVGGQASTQVRVASQAEALAALGPSSVRLMGLPVRAGAGVFRAAADLVRQVPCYYVELGRDFAAIPALVQVILAGALAQSAGSHD